MIKENLSMFDMGGSISEAFCDSCGKRIFTCSSLQWDQKLVYSPLLCETCGQRHNKECGDMIKKIEDLEKEILYLKNLD